MTELYQLSYYRHHVLTSVNVHYEYPEWQAMRLQYRRRVSPKVEIPNFKRFRCLPLIQGGALTIQSNALHVVDSLA